MFWGNSDISPPTAWGWSQKNTGAPPSLVYITSPSMSDKLPGFSQCGCTKDCKSPYNCITGGQACISTCGCNGKCLHRWSFTYPERMNIFLCHECLFVSFHLSSQTSEIYFPILYNFLVYIIYIAVTTLNDPPSLKSIFKLYINQCETHVCSSIVSKCTIG